MATKEGTNMLREESTHALMSSRSTNGYGHCSEMNAAMRVTHICVQNYVINIQIKRRSPPQHVCFHTHGIVYQQGITTSRSTTKQYTMRGIQHTHHVRVYFVSHIRTLILHQPNHFAYSFVGFLNNAISILEFIPTFFA